ncbi:MAG: hypothetical protein ABFS28_11825 [Bacteroidota bacterium]
MNTQGRNIVSRVLVISVLCIVSQNLSAQNPCTGRWEGKFMGDYKTIITLESNGSDSYSGHIYMYAQGEMIQDDALSVIRVIGQELTFYIQAKETHFKGEFNEDVSELSGNFSFPDQSLHPISLQKVKSEEALK